MLQKTKIATLVVSMALLALPGVSWSNDEFCDGTVVQNESSLNNVRYLLALSYLPRVLCGFDVEADAAAWRNVYERQGCKTGSAVAMVIESHLARVPDWAERNFGSLQDSDPDGVAALCELVERCGPFNSPEIEKSAGAACTTLMKLDTFKKFVRMP